MGHSLNRYISWELYINRYKISFPAGQGGRVYSQVDSIRLFGFGVRTYV